MPLKGSLLLEKRAGGERREREIGKGR